MPLFVNRRRSRPSAPNALLSALLAAQLNASAVALHADEDVRCDSPFSIIIDGGSTGSRLHVFEFVEQETIHNTATTECVRRGSARVDRPLSAFAPLSAPEETDVDALVDYILPLFHYAAKVVPERYHNCTLATYQATAGMRLLTEWQQEAVYDAMYAGLMELPLADFAFRGMQPRDIQTLSGSLEGLYGAVAANYLNGTINADLEWSSAEGGDKQEQADPIGALDMGGSSTQIVYLPKEHKELDQAHAAAARDACEGAARVDVPGTCPSSDSDQSLNGNDFFSHSYLAYGVDQFRERLWSTLVEDAKARLTRQDEMADDNECLNDEDGTCPSGQISNPCANPGYVVEWDGYTLIGTGETKECIYQVRRLLPNSTHAVAPSAECAVGDVKHPSVRGIQFYAMSLFFFSLDSLRFYSTNAPEAHEAVNLNWPTPSLDELVNALPGLCTRDWDTDLAVIEPHQKHQYTRPQVLPHRCLESVYLVTLLKDGFGFDPTARSITFAFDVNGSEVEWTLGMALAMRQEQQQRNRERLARNTEVNATTVAPSTGTQDESSLATGELASTPSSCYGTGCGRDGFDAALAEASSVVASWNH